jgi:hypothetical protein
VISHPEPVPEREEHRHLKDDQAWNRCVSAIAVGQRKQLHCSRGKKGKQSRWHCLLKSPGYLVDLASSKQLQTTTGYKNNT